MFSPIMNPIDLVGPDVAQVIQLFSRSDAPRFPDLDATTLQDAVVRLGERHLELVRAEAVLAAAKAAVDDAHEVLLKRSLRGHAYLRVFAEGDPELAALVDAIDLRRSRRVSHQGGLGGGLELTGADAAPRRRGRPRKPATAASLFPVSLSDEQRPSAG
jgi:hypothetical protein